MYKYFCKRYKSNLLLYNSLIKPMHIQRRLLLPTFLQIFLRTITNLIYIVLFTLPMSTQRTLYYCFFSTIAHLCTNISPNMTNSASESSRRIFSANLFIFCPKIQQHIRKVSSRNAFPSFSGTFGIVCVCVFLCTHFFHLAWIFFFFFVLRYIYGKKFRVSFM